MANINNKKDEGLTKPLNHRITGTAIKSFNLAYNAIEKEALKKNISISKGSFLDALVKKCSKDVVITDIKL